MRPPDGGPPKCVEATPDVLTPLMVAGWSQCEAPDQSGNQEDNDGENS